MPQINMEELAAITSRYGPQPSKVSHPKSKASLDKAAQRGAEIELNPATKSQRPIETAPTLEDDVQPDLEDMPDLHANHIQEAGSQEALEPPVDQTRAFKDPSESSRPSLSDTFLVPNKTIIDAEYIETSSAEYIKCPLIISQLVPDNLQSLPTLLLKLSAMLPLNSIQMPTHFYRADLLALSDFRFLRQYWDILKETPFPKIADYPNLQEELDRIESACVAARIELDYIEGFPSIESRPIWTQLSWEPAEAYQAFQEYLAMGLDDQTNELMGSKAQARQLHKLIHLQPGQALEYHNLFNWPLRIKAFELYQVAVHHQTRVRRSLTLDDVHFRQAGKMLSKVMQAFENVTQEAWDALPPHRLVEMAERLMKVQRMSAGLSPTQGGKEQTIQAPTIQSTMEQVAQLTKDDSRSTSTLDELEQTPEMLEVAQRLLLTAGNQQFGITKHLEEKGINLGDAAQGVQANPDDGFDSEAAADAEEAAEILNG